MGFRFRKSANIGPLRVNFSKSGVGYSVGGKGFRVTKRADGRTQTTASVPGTGIAYTTTSGSRSSKSAGGSGKKKGPAASAVLIVLLIVGLAGCMASGGKSDEQNTPDKPAASVTESAAASMVQKEDPAEPEPEAATEPEPETELEPEPAKELQEAPSAVTQPVQASTDAPAKETPAEAPQQAAAPVQDQPKAETAAQAQEQPKAETPKPSTETSTPVAATPAPAPAADPQTGMVIGNRNSKKYHEPSCSSVKDMKEKNKVTFDSAEAAEAKGYEPCARCH